MASFGLGRASADSSSISPATPIDSSTPWMAASEGNLALLQSSLERLKLTAAAADDNGYTLLQAAASYNQLEIMRFLLSHGAKVDAADQDGDTALHYAGGVPAASFLVETAQINKGLANTQGKTALQTKQEELDDMLQDEDVEDDDDDLEALKATVRYLSSTLP